ncbi:MAG: hypothetical protein M0Q43_01530 [Methanothrix sp.]|nr:hypothetical protein [Methanothrix sp.]
MASSSRPVGGPRLSFRTRIHPFLAAPLHLLARAWAGDLLQGLPAFT